MNKLLQNIHKYTEKYVSSAFVLTLDVILSIVSSLSAVLILYAIQQVSIDVPLLLSWVGMGAIFALVCFYLCHTYRVVIRHFTLRELPKFVISLFVRYLLLECVMFFIYFSKICEILGLSINRIIFLGVVDTVILLAILILVRSTIIIFLDYIRQLNKSGRLCENLFVYGTGDKSVALITRLQHSSKYKIVGFIMYGKETQKYTLAECPILYVNNKSKLEKYKTRYDASVLLFPIEDAVKQESDRLIPLATECGLKVMVTPSVDEVIDGKISHSNLREIKIEDLLGRSEIHISMDEIKNNFFGKTVMVTGAAGSIGSELCRQLATFGISKLILFDNAETPMHNLRLQLEDGYPELEFIPIIGDVRNKNRLDYVFTNYHPQIVFHAAAYKHVPLMEDNPCEAIHVNVTGSHYVANKCVEYGVEMMVMISTDKAVNPTNVMGCSKRLAEIYVQSLGLSISNGIQEGKTKFVTTRFGNVLGSNGSVIPRFTEQIKRGGPVTVTHPDIIRFFMTIPEACRLVMEAATMSRGNEIFVFDMGKAVKIDYMARRMIELAGFVPDKDIKIEYIGLRPGEKLYEEVLANAENTMPTNHQRIKIAKVREYDYEEAHRMVNDLTVLAVNMKEAELIEAIKRSVPEYQTTNPKFK